MCPCCVTGDEQDGVEPKPHPMYENMQISAVLQPHLADKDADSSSTDAGEFHHRSRSHSAMQRLCSG